MLWTQTRAEISAKQRASFIVEVNKALAFSYHPLLAPSTASFIASDALFLARSKAAIKFRTPDVINDSAGMRDAQGANGADDVGTTRG